MRSGRFGWRGHVANLSDFVLTACAMELGLETPNHPQVSDPTVPARLAPKAKGPDLSNEQCDDLFEFVASLEPPQQVVPNDPQAAALVNNGQALFHSIGCAACHMARLGNVEGIFSDLLLHDMGAGLNDPLPANPEKTRVGTRSIGGGYGGGSFDVFAELPTSIRREWRTPPLWGVADSAPYLHDGRASTLEDAIIQHGGEAQSSKERFLELPTENRTPILLFLQTLRAPAAILRP